MMPVWHHLDSDPTYIPLQESTITWFGSIFARLRPIKNAQAYLATGL